MDENSMQSNDESIEHQAEEAKPKISIDGIVAKDEEIQENPKPKKKHKKLIVVSIVIGVLAVLGACGAFAYYYSLQFSKPKEEKKQENVVKPVVTPPVVDNTPEIVWNDPKLVSSLQLFAGDDGNGFNREKEAKYYSVGKYQKGVNKGSEIILASAPYGGPSIYPGFFRLLKTSDNKLVLLTKYSDKLYDGDTTILTSKFTKDDQTDISDLDYPDTITGSNNRQIITADRTVNEFFSLTNLKSAFKDNKYGDVYTTDVTISNSSSINDKFGFYLKAVDGTVRVYYLKADFIDANGVTNITWYNGVKNTDKYALGDVAGCGRRNYATVIADAKNKKQQYSGKTSSGDSLYDNQTDYETLDFYNNKYQGEWNDAQKKMVKVTYQQFLAAHPLIFWTDPFGRTIQLEDTRFIYQGGCGKPVIYLYPTKSTNVSVKLDPQGGFTKTEPAYNNGWNVLADPLGSLKDLLTGKVYPYLFWEGYGNLYQEPDKGFVVKKNEVHTFLNDKLAKLGLNSKEIADFQEFWEPKMKSSPYYFVSFWGNREMDAIAPLTIDPKPDTVIRILMDFRPLQQPIKVQGYDIKTPARKGFTVVEWGGVLR